MDPNACLAALRAALVEWEQAVVDAGLTVKQWLGTSVVPVWSRALSKEFRGAPHGRSSNQSPRLF